MRSKYWNPGIKSFLLRMPLVVLMGACGAALFHYEGFRIYPHLSSWINFLILSLIIGISLQLFFLVFSIPIFFRRNDPYIFMGIFEGTVEGLRVSDAVNTLISLGYKVREESPDRALLVREQWPSNQFFPRQLDFRWIYHTEIKPKQNGVYIKFYIPGREDKFDGTELTYRAAKEFEKGIAGKTFTPVSINFESAE